MEGPIKRRACVNCTTAKSKCLPHSANLCQRCHRLGKSCRYLDLPERRKRPRGSYRRVDDLEDKVARLTSQLTALSNPLGVALTPNSTVSPITSASANSHENRGEPPCSTTQRRPRETTTHPRTPSIIDQGILTLNEASYVVAHYWALFHVKWPFVALDDNDLARHLHVEQPFLLLCIAVATLPRTHEKWKRLNEEAFSQVTSRIVVGSERSLELLRGLLIYCVWFSFPFEHHRERLTLLVQLCVNLVYDLGLHKAKSLTYHARMAALGTYWLTIGMNCLGKPIVMRCDDALPQWANDTINSAEEPDWVWTRHFVELQSFIFDVDESRRAIRLSKLDRPVLTSVTVLNGTHSRQFRGLKERAERDLDKCPDPMKRALIAELNFAEMRTDFAALRDDLWPDDDRNTVSEKCNGTQRVSMLWSLLRQSRRVIEGFIDLPESDMACIHLFTLFQLCQSFASLLQSVPFLLQLAIGGPATSAPLTAEERVECQAILDEADFIGVSDRMLAKTEPLVRDFPPEELDAHAIGNLWTEIRLLRKCYPHRIRTILGEDLLGQGSSKSQPRDDPNAGSSDSQVDNSAAYGAAASWSDADMGLDDSNFVMDDTQWTSFLESLNFLS